jgi:hypothetical protein
LAPRPGFGLDSLPLGVACVQGARSPHGVVAFEGDAIDLAVVRHHGVLAGDIDPAAVASASLNRLLVGAPTPGAPSATSRARSWPEAA